MLTPALGVNQFSIVEDLNLLCTRTANGHWIMD